MFAVVAGLTCIGSAVVLRAARISSFAGGMLPLAAVDSTPTTAAAEDGSPLVRLPSAAPATVPAAASAPAAPTSRPASQPTTSTAPLPAPVPTPTPTPAPAAEAVPGAILADDPAALAAYERGVSLQSQGKLIEARAQLSDALLRGKLSDGKSADCRKRLNLIADAVVFSPQCLEGDALSYSYTIRTGDLLVSVVKSQGLRVPAEAIQLVNGMSDPRKIRPGQKIKLIRGPVDAVITKHTFTLDLYHEGLFIRSYAVGLGQNDSTPVGQWVVAEGGRAQHATWNPPASSGQTRTIHWGQPGYPLGKAGVWIALRGLDANTQSRSGYGIHGTDDPASIGKQGSLGCVRMADEDIEEVYAFLLDGVSKVETRP